MNQLLAFSLSNDALRLLVVLEGLAVPDIAMTEVEAIRSVTGLNVDVALQELVTRNAVTVTDYMVTVTGYKAVTVTGYNGVTGNHDAVSDNDKRAKNRAKVRECRERKRAAEAGYKPVTVTGYKAVTVTNTPPSLSPLPSIKKESNTKKEIKSFPPHPSPHGFLLGFSTSVDDVRGSNPISESDEATAAAEPEATPAPAEAQLEAPTAGDEPSDLGASEPDPALQARAKLFLDDPFGCALSCGALEKWPELEPIWQAAKDAWGRADKPRSATDVRAQNVAKRLAEGYSVAELAAAVKGSMNVPVIRDNKPNQRLSVVLSEGDRVEAYALAEPSQSAKSTSSGKRGGLIAVQRDESKGTPLPQFWLPSAEDLAAVVEAYPEAYAYQDILVERFRAYWHLRLGDDALRSDWAHTFRSTAKMTVAEVRGRLLDCVLKPRTKADWDCRAENWRWEQERRAEGLDNKQIFDLRQAKAKAKKIEELREFAMREDKDELHIVAVIRKKYHVFSDEEILDMMPDQRRNIAAELMRKDKEGEISIEDIYQERAKAYSLEKRRGNV